MSPEAKTQLTKALELPGAAAWCVGTPGQGYEHHCYTDWFKPAQLEAMTAKLAQAMEGLRRRQVEPAQACWTFEHARLLLSQRADGTTLVLFAENRPDLLTAQHQAAMLKYAAGN